MFDSKACPLSDPLGFLGLHPSGAALARKAGQLFTSCTDPPFAGPGAAHLSARVGIGFGSGLWCLITTRLPVGAGASRCSSCHGGARAGTQQAGADFYHQHLLGCVPRQPRSPGCPELRPCPSSRTPPTCFVFIGNRCEHRRVCGCRPSLRTGVGVAQPLCSREASGRRASHPGAGKAAQVLGKAAGPWARPSRS